MASLFLAHLWWNRNGYHAAYSDRIAHVLGLLCARWYLTNGCGQNEVDQEYGNFKGTTPELRVMV